MATDIFQSALVKKPKRARFDFSHSNTFGMKIGYAYPTEVRFVVPGDEVAVSMNQVARLAPMPVPTFADLKVRHDWFFVPCRLMYNEKDMANIFGSAGDSSATPRSAMHMSTFIDCFSVGPKLAEHNPTDTSSADFRGYVNMIGDLWLPGSLFDFLGYPVPNDVNISSENVPSLLGVESQFTYNNGYKPAQDMYDALVEFEDVGLADSKTSAFLLIEPLLAYHFIWRDWYRFTGVQDSSVLDGYLENHCLSSEYFGDIVDSSEIFSNILGNDYFHPGAGSTNTIGRVLGRLRQVHLAKDMFTSVRYGSKPTVLIPTGENANIPTLREASAIQRFIDLVSIVGSRYFDKVKALFNVRASGFADDRVQFLARYQQFIKIGEVLTTATTTEGQTGDYAGRGILIDGKYLFRRSFDEPGWLMCITSIVPDIAYTGLSRQLTDRFFVDTPIPALAQIGDQTVFHREVNFQYDSGSNNDTSFGDQFRYYAYKSAINEVHGSFLMSSMRSWVPTQDYHPGAFDVNYFSRVSPADWNKFFNDKSTSPIFGDRFFFKLDFTEFITRQLPKYINYHL